MQCKNYGLAIFINFNILKDTYYLYGVNTVKMKYCYYITF